MRWLISIQYVSVHFGGRSNCCLAWLRTNTAKQSEMIDQCLSKMSSKQLQSCLICKCVEIDKETWYKEQIHSLTASSISKVNGVAWLKGPTELLIFCLTTALLRCGHIVLDWRLTDSSLSLVTPVRVRQLHKCINWILDSSENCSLGAWA